ncbi:MAG: invasin domain 3-containing protein [Solirubrobacterales bacterium]
MGSPGAVLYQPYPTTPTQVVAGSNGGLTIEFTASSALGGGDTVTITGPQGTDFSGLTGPNNYNTMTNVTTGSGYSTIGSLSFSDGGRTVTAEIPAPASVTQGQKLGIDLSIARALVTFGTTAGPSSFLLSTNRDTTPAATPPYQTLAAAPIAVVAVEGPQRTPFNQVFDPMDVMVVDQYGNGVPAQNVSATVAPTGPSGTFPGGLTDAQVVTGSDGQATLPTITANGQIGFWELDLQGPAASTDVYEMHNLAYGDPEAVSLALAPSSAPADGVSKVTATATVTDQYGNPVPDEQVALSSDGGQQIGVVTDNADGTYTGEITTTTITGQSVITATDGSGGDAISGTATLTQTALPAKTIALTLNPSSLPADGKSTTTATAVVKDAFGNDVSGAEVNFSGDGGQPIGAVSEGAPGTYSATITAGSSAGPSQISATVAGISPALVATASLTQTAVPVNVIKPVLKFTNPPKKKVKSAKVKFKFKVTKGKAKGFQCKLDKKKWSKCKSPKKVKLKKGKHVFKVRGIATDGSFGKTLKRKIKRVK